MEYLHGFGLDALIQQFGPLPEGRVIHILRQICGALAEAHQIGLIHRDVKPANVMLLSRSGLCDLAKVLDFGLVKAMSPILQADLQDGSKAMGTPRYMSPEAIEHPEAVDSRSDLYSLGAIGYFLLTGKPLFEDDNWNEVLKHQIHTIPTLPSERLGSSIMPQLETLIMQCLAKTPDERPQSAKLLEVALAECAHLATWTTSDAELWWEQNGAALDTKEIIPAEEEVLVVGPRDVELEPEA